MSHNEDLVETKEMEYAGRTNIFAADFQVPEVAKDYEVLKLGVTAADADAVNFGHHQRTIKLLPRS